MVKVMGRAVKKYYPYRRKKFTIDVKNCMLLLSSNAFKTVKFHKNDKTSVYLDGNTSFHEDTGWGSAVYLNRCKGSGRGSMRSLLKNAKRLSDIVAVIPAFNKGIWGTHP